MGCRLVSRLRMPYWHAGNDGGNICCHVVCECMMIGVFWRLAVGEEMNQWDKIRCSGMQTCLGLCGVVGWAVALRVQELPWAAARSMSHAQQGSLCCIRDGDRAVHVLTRFACCLALGAFAYRSFGGCRGGRHLGKYLRLPSLQMRLVGSLSFYATNPSSLFSPSAQMDW